MRKIFQVVKIYKSSNFLDMTSNFLLFNLTSKVCLQKRFLNPIRNLHSIRKNRPNGFFKFYNLQSVHRQFSLKTRQFKNSKLGSLNLKKTLAGSLLFGSGILGAVYNSEKIYNGEISSLNFSDLVKSILSFFVQYAECEEKRKDNDITVKKNRTALYEETLGNSNEGNGQKKEPNFDWNEFFKLIYQEKYYFLAAVAVNQTF